MESELVRDIQEMLDNMTQEEFDKEMTEIRALNLGGPSCDEMSEYLLAMLEQEGVSKEFLTEYYSLAHVEAKVG